MTDTTNKPAAAPPLKAPVTGVTVSRTIGTATSSFGATMFFYYALKWWVLFLPVELRPDTDTIVGVASGLATIPVAIIAWKVRGWQGVADLVGLKSDQ